VGFPFVGRSGKLLDRMLADAGLDVWKDIYVSNIVKCRPIEYETNKDRKPLFDEVSLCENFIIEELKTINPQLIITLGRTSSDWYSRFISNKISYDINVFYEEQKWLPTYHPSYLLRTGLKDAPLFIKTLKDTLEALHFERNKTELQAE
jgi:uracil-DNA glycosylase family 4